MEKLLELFKKMQELNDDPSNSSWYRIIIHPNGQAYLVKCPGDINPKAYPREAVHKIITSADLTGSLPTKKDFSESQILI